MRISVLMIAMLGALALPVVAPCQTQTPMMTQVDPDTGRAGDVIVVQGSNLDQDCVAAVYLTDGQKDAKVTIIEQSATSIRFRIPMATKPGRFTVMVLTKGKPPQLIEEPVKIVVEPETGSR
jgi:hypothetical protein